MQNIWRNKWKIALAGTLVLAAGSWWSGTPSWGFEFGPRVLNGRMSGGGSIFTDENDLWAPAGTRLTHGFDLHCDSLTQPNNLQVEVHLPNGTGGMFHLDALTLAWCWDDPEIDSSPGAPFNSYFGAGTGQFNGVAGYCADWYFTDAGQPGTEDRVRSMRIWQPLDGNCANETQFLFSLYLEPGHTLTFGNH